MGLGSFEALGASHAIARHAAREADREGGPIETAAMKDMLAGSVFTCASAGNHGFSVAAGARIFGADDPDSGGLSVFLSPGLQYVTRRWIVEAIVQLPVAEDLNGSALEDDVIVRAGFRINF